MSARNSYRRARDVFVRLCSLEVKIRDLVDGLLRNRVAVSLIRKYDWNWEQRASSQNVEETKEGEKV